MESHPGLVRVCPGHTGHGLTHRVDRVLPGRCTGRSFDKPEPVQPPGRPGPETTRRAGPGLITMVLLSSIISVTLIIKLKMTLTINK
jgi:hypothetical protein